MSAITLRSYETVHFYQSLIPVQGWLLANSNNVVRAATAEGLTATIANFAAE